MLYQVCNRYITTRRHEIEILLIESEKISGFVSYLRIIWLFKMMIDEELSFS